MSLFIVFILLHCPEANKYALTQHTTTNILRLYFTSILLQKDAANIIKECTNVILTPISHFLSLEGAGSCHFINDCCVFVLLFALMNSSIYQLLLVPSCPVEKEIPC